MINKYPIKQAGCGSSIMRLILKREMYTRKMKLLKTN